MKTFKGTAEITDEGVKKHFKSFEPSNAIFELVWNGLDANASAIKISTIFNEMDGLEAVEVLDNGEGIDLKNLKNSFRKFNESSKKNDDDKHGSHGKGRLAFHKLCTSASWYTKTTDRNAKIDIDAAAIREYQGNDLEQFEQHASLYGLEYGTCVVLKNFLHNKLPDEEQFIKKLGNEFGWYLALNKDRAISVNGKPVQIPRNEIHIKTVNILNNEFTIRVIRWDERPSSEKSYNYLIDKNNKIIAKELSKTNNKVAFYTSAYAFSKWLDDYDDEILELETAHGNSRKIIKDIFHVMTSFQREIYSGYLRKHVDEELYRFEEEGFFPIYKGLDKKYADWRKANTKEFVKEIYIADPQIFNRLNPKQAKILIRLLDAILVSNENDTLFEVLEGVLDLSSENVDQLASQIKAITFENIISTIETLQQRQKAIHQLREIMDNRYSEVLETPDLQKIIENNTWLFGPQYTTLGAEENTFTTIAKTLKNTITLDNLITAEDIENGLSLEGVNRQVDLFLARKIPTFDSTGNQIYKCVIVEIKRPGISLNKNHLKQVDDYCEIISKHPAFGSKKMYFEIILIGRKISKDDFQIRQRMNNLKDKAVLGLVTDSEKMKCYVKDWYTIFDEFELSNSYLLSTLNTKLEFLSAKTTSDLVVELQEK